VDQAVGKDVDQAVEEDMDQAAEQDVDQAVGKDVDQAVGKDVDQAVQWAPKVNAPFKVYAFGLIFKKFTYKNTKITFFCNKHKF